MAKIKLAELVDRGFVLKGATKTTKDEFDDVKSRLKSHGKRFKQSEIRGTKAVAVFGPSGSGSVDMKALYAAYCDQGRESDFFEAINPNLTQIREDWGETKCDELIKVKKIPYGKVHFRKL